MSVVQATKDMSVEIYTYDEEIVRQLIASGIDMTVLPKEELVKYVREYWPYEIIDPKTSNACRLKVEQKGSECYYENVAAAAETKNRKLVELFLSTGFVPSQEQQEEIESYLNGGGCHHPRGNL